MSFLEKLIRSPENSCGPKGPRGQNNHEKKNKAEGLTHLNFKTCYKAILSRRCGTGTRIKIKINGTEDQAVQKTSTHLLSIAFNKSTKVIQ